MNPNETNEIKKLNIFSLLLYNKIILLFLIITLIKLWLVASQSISAFNSPHDDEWYVNHAISILSDHWMGDYNQMTLIKGPFYSIWIAFCFLLSIPLLFAQHLLYIFSCLILIYAIRPLIPKLSTRFIIYIILLFNPMNFIGNPTTRIVRDVLCPNLVILITACSIGMILSIGDRLRNIIFWALGLGLSLSAFWLTREDGIWVLPLVFIFIFVTIFFIWKNHISNPVKRVFICIAPIFILFFSNFTISAINWIYYKDFVVTDFNSYNYYDAYGALLRVKPKEWIPQNPVSRETMSRIYDVSPAFRELKPYLDVAPGTGWPSGVRNWEAGVAGVWLKNYPVKEGEYYAWFMWALRDAVASAGYYSSSEKENNYYKRLAAEVNKACDAKILESVSGKRVSMIPPWRNDYFIPIIQTFSSSVEYVIKFKDANAMPGVSDGSEELLGRFQKVSGSRLSLSGKYFKLNKFDYFKIQILNAIGKIYQIFTPILSIIAILSFLGLSIEFLMKRKDFIWWIIFFTLFTSIIARLLLLSMVSVFSFYTINALYLLSVYPLFILIITLIFIKSVVEIKNIFSKKEIKKE